jgi:hypothetical protein
MEHWSADAGSNAMSFSLRMVDQADLFIAKFPLTRKP